MATVYRPRSVGLKNIALAVAPLMIILAIFALSASNDLLTAIGGLVFILSFAGLFLLLGFRWTYVELADDRVEIVKFLFFRNHMEISKIKSMKYRTFGTKGLDSIKIEYVTALGARRVAVLGSIGAYGQHQIASIIRGISQSNRSVYLDGATEALIAK